MTGPVFGPLNATGDNDTLRWCGAGEPVVLAGVDCSRVRAGQDGLTDDEAAAVADLRAAAIEDPTQALELTQRMQSMLASAPGQLCRLMQRGQVPAGDAQANAEELAATVCPFSVALDFGLVDHGAWRYGELDLSSGESAVRALVDAHDRADWHDLVLLVGPAGLTELHRSINDLDVASLVQDVEAVPAPLNLHPDQLVRLFEAADPLVRLAGPVESVVLSADGMVAELALSGGSASIALERASDGRWRIRAISTGGIVDSNGPFFQP